MTDSLVHAAFHPLPYVLLGLCSVTIGALLEVGWTRVRLHRLTRYFPWHSTGHTVGGHAPGYAER